MYTGKNNPHEVSYVVSISMWTDKKHNTVSSGIYPNIAVKVQDRSKIKVLARYISFWGLFPCPVGSDYLCPHMAFLCVCCAKKERREKVLRSLLMRKPYYVWVPLLWPHVTLITFLGALSPNGLGLQCRNLRWGDKIHIALGDDFPFFSPEVWGMETQSFRNIEGDFKKGKQPPSSLAGVPLEHRTYKLHTVLTFAS